MSNSGSTSSAFGVAGALIEQLHALIVQEADESRLNSFTIIYSNLTHIVAYSEGNARFLTDVDGLQEIRAFLRANDFGTRAGRWVCSVRPCSSRGERTRTEWLTYFESRTSSRGTDAVHQEEQAALALARSLRASALDVAGLLGRLGISQENVGHDAAFFAVASRVEDSGVRGKLHQAWVSSKCQRNDDIIAAVQRLIEARFWQAKQTQFRTPLKRALANATISSDAIGRFLDDYLCEAVELARDLSSTVKSAIGFPAGWAVDFPRYLSVTEPGDQPLVLPLQGCIGLLTEITVRILGLMLEPAESQLARDSSGPFVVKRDGIALGTIIFQTAEANFAPSNRSDYASLARSALPIGHVLCRMTSPDRPGMTFDAARVLFHEFGHALVHILVPDRRPGVSGLDYLPVERLEFLSTWFEHWVYHRALEDTVGFSEREVTALGRARRIKAFEFMKSNLTRAVCAVVDFQIHADPNASVRDTLRQLRKRHSEIDNILDSELLADFAHPLLLAHPGCSFVYPLASSYALEKLLPLMSRPVREISSELCPLEICVAPGGICHMPEATAPRDFFEAVIRPISHCVR